MRKTILLLGVLLLLAIIRPASAAAKFPVVFRTPDNYLKDRLCCLLIRKFVLFATLWFYLLAKYFNPLKLSKCGDFHPNPGPEQNYENFLSKNSKHSSSLSFVHINCQSINKKREQLKKLLTKVSDNTIIGLTETWLTSGNDRKLLWEFDSAKYTAFRYHSEHNKDIMEVGVLLLFIPNLISPQKVNSFPETDKHTNNLG